MKFTTPGTVDVFTITSEPLWPSIVLATDAQGPHTWKWSLQSCGLNKAGVVQTPGNNWDAQTVVKDCGGVLTVAAACGGATVSITIKIKATNPSQDEVSAYLATKPDAAGFEKILRHESKFKNFGATGEPIKSFDNGFGMCQLTTPAPTLDQMWNWKLNIDGGLALFAAKRGAAARYLSQSGRTYTEDQLLREAVCRWNGGAYHVWDAAAGKWIRNPKVFCDSATGNIGWDMSDPANAGKSEAELHQRDAKLYAKGPAAGAHWKYFGICYADAILR